MAKRRRTLYDRYSGQAQATALLKSSPERRGLRALLLEAQSQKDADIAAARTSSRVNRGAIREADPRIAQVYADAQAGLSAVTGDYSKPAAGIAKDFAALGPAAGSIAEAARAEAEGAQRRTVEAGTRARTDLEQQGIRAAEGEGFAVRAAQDRFRGDAGKILSQLTGVDQEEGLFAATELGRLVDAAAGRGVTRAGQRSTARERRADRESRERVASQNRESADRRASGKGPGKKWAPSGEQKQLRQTIGQARKYAETFKSTGTSRSEAAGILSTGQKAQPVYDPKTGKKRLNPDGTPQTVAGVPEIKDELALNVALDVAYDGHISRRNQRLLHKNGYRISPLGLVTYGQARRKRRNQPPYHGPARPPGGGV